MVNLKLHNMNQILKIQVKNKIKNDKNIIIQNIKIIHNKYQYFKIISLDLSINNKKNKNSKLKKKVKKVKGTISIKN